MRERAGSMPPITSTTTSTSSRATSPAASVVSRPSGTSTSRGASSRRTATPTSSTGTPTRAAMSSCCSASSRTTWEPTAPQPSTATFKVRFPPSLMSDTHIGRQQVGDSLSSQHGESLPVPNSDHRRTQRVVVVGGHGSAVGAGAGHRHQVAGTHVSGQELVLDDDVAGLAVLADDPGQDRRGVGAARGERGGVVGVVEGGADVVAHAPVDGDVRAPCAPVELDLLDGADLVDGAHGWTDDRPAGLDREPRLADPEPAA